MSNTPLTIRARWIFPVDGPPLEGACIRIADGKIQAIDATPTHHPDIDFGDAAILPGFINAHTHLDLSGAKGRVPHRNDFTAWLRGVIHYRRGLTPEQTLAGVQTGLAECLATGTTLVGDISAMGLSEQVLVDTPLWGVVFFELLGLQKDRAFEMRREATRWRLERSDSYHCKPGMSPHAPYSVRRVLFKMVRLMSQAWSLPVAIHLAESRDELQLIEERSGPLVTFLEELGVWDPTGPVGSLRQLIKEFEAAPKVLFIHCNYLDPSTTLRPGHTIVYCPRTHAAFGHPPHPFREFLARGVRVALGTDSLASNPDLDMLAETRFVRQLYPELPGDVLLRMATLAGAEALGLEQKTGSLAVGKSADLIVIPIESAGRKDPHELIWESNSKVKSVMWCGRWIHGRI